MVPFAGLLAALEQIPDPRRRQGRRYGLAPLLLFSVLAVLAGATSYRRIRLFIGVHRERLNATFGARFRRAPAVNTLRALLHALDPAEVEAAQALIEQLGLSGILFTADALHCQKNLRHRGGDRQRAAGAGQGQPAAPA